MPGSEKDDADIRQAYADGRLSEKEIRLCAGRIISLINKLDKKTKSDIGKTRTGSLHDCLLLYSAHKVHLWKGAQTGGIMEIYSIKDEKFRRYGKVWSGFDCTRLIREMEHTPLPEDVIYVPSMEELEVLPEAGEFARRIYGGLPIQIGYCNGSNHRLNALEYHRNSEINIAVTNMVLLLGWLPDVTDAFTYDTSRVEAFFVPAGTVVEMYGTTLHYAPCNDGGGRI